MQVVLTTRCNLRCSYCYQTRSQSADMSWPVLRSALDWLAAGQARQRRLAFYGGEPLLCFTTIKRAVQHLEAKRAPPRFSLITNGTLLDREVLAFLIAHDFELKLSFDGVAAAQELRGAGTYATLERLVRVLARDFPGFNRDRVEVVITVSSGNLAHLAASVAYLVKRGVRNIAIQPLITHDPGWGPEVAAELDAQLARIVDLSIRHFENTGEVPLDAFRPRAHRRTPRTDGALCNMGSGGNVSVDVDGNVYTCVGLVPSLQRFPSELLARCSETLRVGHVSDPDLLERLASYPERARAIGMFHERERQHSSLGRCAECHLVKRCSVCPLTAGYVPDNTDPTRVSDHACGFERAVALHRRRFLVRSGLLHRPLRIPRLPRSLQRLFEQARAR